ncbi:MAG: adenylosuccinate synthase [Candidatus Diapherotrites archaeon]|nr:adenylosuccinate synthase [Candidatus Diapherotrites archaeon]
MPLSVIIGAQFGDEGKGKIIDYLSEKADIVVRFNGGDNAGHTVVVGNKTYKLHLMPSGAVQKKICCLASGVAINPKTLLEEIELIEKEVGKVKLFVDPRAQIIMPYHLLLDGASEEKKCKKIGTTKKGIGPCYADRASRQGIRFSEFINKNKFYERLKEVVPLKNLELKAFGLKQKNAEALFKELSKMSYKLKKYQMDVSKYLHVSLKNGKEVLLEGAQGFFLDNDFGTYPYVTSSHTGSAGAFMSAGIAYHECRVIGVSKAYCTRVGAGPFPTEINGSLASAIREKGNEYGTTTGRPRRVGWLDLPMLRTASRICGFTEIALTKLDVLSGLKEIKVSTAYKIGGKKVKEVPADTFLLEKCKPMYVRLKGFELSHELKSFYDLPSEARSYIKLIEKNVGIRVRMISYGPERKQTLIKAQE